MVVLVQVANKIGGGEKRRGNKDQKCGRGRWANKWGSHTYCGPPQSGVLTAESHFTDGAHVSKVVAGR